MYILSRTKDLCRSNYFPVKFLLVQLYYLKIMGTGHEGGVRGRRVLGRKTRGRMTLDGGGHEDRGNEGGGHEDGGHRGGANKKRYFPKRVDTRA